MKARIFNRSLSAIIFTLLISTLLIIPQTAYAAQETQDGVVLELTTNKSSYASDEAITGTITITNTNAFAIHEVSLDTLHSATHSFTLSDPSLSSTSLNPGETLRFDFATQTTKNTGGESVLAKANDGMLPAAILIAIVLFAAILVLALSRKKLEKRSFGVFSLVLLLAIALPVSLSASPQQALAGNTSLSAKETVMVGEDTLDIQAIASYTIPTSQTVAFLTADLATKSHLPGVDYILTLEKGGVLSASSDANGNVAFSNVPFGTHELSVSAVPDGYVKLPNKYPVEVTVSEVIINGKQPNRFVVEIQPISEAPTVNQPAAGDMAITGTGVPNASVHARFFDGSGELSTRVEADGTWMITAPNALVQDEYVEVYQVVPPKAWSEIIKITVS